MKPHRISSPQEHEEFVLNQLFAIDNLELLILKAHILVEHSIILYLESLSNSKEPDFFKPNFSFSQKLELLKHFGTMSLEKSNHLEEMYLLNKLRNDLAHTLTYNSRHLNDFLSAVEKKVPNIFDDDEEDVEKFRVAVSYILGGFGARLFINDKSKLETYLDDLEKQ